MPRTTIIAAALAMLLLVAPAASAMPIDPVSPAPAGEAKAQPKVMPERITDHPVLPTADEIKRALAQEDYYAHRDPAHATLVAEQEPTSGSGNQGTAHATAPAPLPADDDAPWVLIGAGFLGIALLFGAAVALIARPRRARVAV